MRLQRPLVFAAYLLLAACLSWPLAAAGGLVGYPNVDATDTVALRGMVVDLLSSGGGVSDGAYFPTGYPVLQLTPNLADHLTGAPLAALGFPLGDRLWWLLVLAAVGAAGHHLGRQLGGSHGAGALAGAALLCSEAVLREANLHHALHSSHALQTVADGLPALGIVAAVLGVIKTMGSIDQPPEILGKLIGGALVGTFLGVFLAYGLVGPFAAKVKAVVEEDSHFYQLIREVLVANLHNHVAAICIEVGRQNTPSHIRPGYSELEEALKSAKQEAA